MHRRPTAVVLAAATLAATALAALAMPPAAPAKKREAKRPEITRVTPMRLRVGTTLTVRGRNFSAKRTRNTLIFRAHNGRSVFAKPSRATSRKLVVRVPAALASIVRKTSRLKIRVLAGRFSAFTPKRLSPVLVPPVSRGITPNPPGTPGTPNVPGTPGPPGTPGNPVPPVDCTPGDFDGDLLPTALEARLKTDPCLKDTDRDGIEDGFEYRSAVDLNDDEFQEPNQSLPYPGKRPYPNPLDPSDGDISYDGDTLTQREEQALWNYAIAQGATRTLSPLEYSDGEQFSKIARGPDNRRFPTLLAAGYAKSQSFKTWASSNGYDPVMLSDGAPWYSGATRNSYSLFDFNRSGSASASELLYYDNGDGFLNDDERDEDADGLTNRDETHGRATPGYWAGCYDEEKPYYVAYAGTSSIDPDSDGDGVRDGADDQDHDDVPNVSELSRFAASGLSDVKPGFPCTPAEGLPEYPAPHHDGVYGQVNPFNPCMPARWSRTCPSSFNEDTGAPFDGSLNWLSLN